MSELADPGYGDPNAPVGSAEWAKRWRLCFQTEAKRTPFATGVFASHFKVGAAHRAWTLVTDAGGQFFRTFDEFCACKQPWGLGLDPAKAHAYLKDALGEKAAELMTVSPGTDKGGRPANGEETADTVSAVSDGDKRKSERLRAILRAPEIIQDLYREGLVSQTTAAKMGPKSPTPEQAGQIAEARQRVEQLGRPPADDAPARKRFRREADGVIRGRLGVRAPSDYDLALKYLLRLSADERRRAFDEILSKESI